MNMLFQKSFKSTFDANIIKLYINIIKNIIHTKSGKPKINKFVLFKNTANSAIFLIIENKKIDLDID